MSPGEIERRIRTLMSEERFLHTVGVKETALMLARVWGGDEVKTVTAALLHDAAREMPLDRMQKLLLESDPPVKISEQVFEDPLLLHAVAGSAIARKEYEVEDRDILLGIERHTTGGRGMSLLEKLIFVADFIEPGRAFRGVNTARALAATALDETMLYIYTFVLRLLVAKGRYVCADSLEGYNELILKKGCK